MKIVIWSSREVSARLHRSRREVGEIVAHAVGAGVRVDRHPLRVLVEHHVAVLEMRQRKIDRMAERALGDRVRQRAREREQDPRDDEDPANHGTMPSSAWMKSGEMRAFARAASSRLRPCIRTYVSSAARAAWSSPIASAVRTRSASMNARGMWSAA